MQMQRINSMSGKAILVLSLIALLTVLTGYLQPRQPAPTDEGAGAHIFQLSVVLTFAAVMIFFFTADWSKRWRSVRPLALPALALLGAFTALYFLEHVYFIQR